MDEADLPMGVEIEEGPTVAEFAGHVLTDVRYALGQLRGCERDRALVTLSEVVSHARRVEDRIQRAIDALERIEGRCAGV